MAQIQTLDGLHGSRECIAVKDRGDGVCQCGAYGPPGSARKPYEGLCKEKRLEVSVGSKKRSGMFSRPGGARRGKMARKKDMDFPPLEDLGEDFGPDFFGLGQMVDMEMLRTAGVALLASGGSQLLGANVLERIDWFADKPKAKAGAAVVAGLVLGRLLWNTSPDRAAAMGALAGLGGMGVARLVGDVAEIPSSLGAAEVMRTPMYDFFSPTRGDVRGLPRGGRRRQLAQPLVEGDDPFAVDGLGEDEVTADSLGSWIGG